MPKIQQRDFFFGAALSMFFKHNQDAKPSLIDTKDNKSQLFRMATDTSEDFYIYMKYTCNELERKRENSHAWQFTFTKNDIEIIERCAQEKALVYIFLICGNIEAFSGEIAIIKKEEYDTIINERSTFIVKTKGERPKNFIIKIDNTLLTIKRNRIEKKITEI